MDFSVTQLIRGHVLSMNNFRKKNKLKKQDYEKSRLKSLFRKFYGQYKTTTLSGKTIFG